MSKAGDHMCHTFFSSLYGIFHKNNSWPTTEGNILLGISEKKSN